MPALRAVTHPHPDEQSPIDKEALAGLCHYAAGITKTIRRGERTHEFRAASCTGALYHIDLYPVCGDLRDVDAGVYHYDPRTEALEVLREGEYRDVLGEASRDPAVREAPVTFVATSTWWRNAWKYRDRTYRHAFWDSGTLLANLHATASALGLPARTVLGYADDSVARLLGIDPEWEAPLALVPVGSNAPAPEPTEVNTVESLDPSTEPLQSNPRDHPLIYRAWQASTLPDGATASQWRSRGERPVDGRGPGDGIRIELEPVAADTASNRPLHNTIRRRGSCREYARETISFRKVSTVLDRAVGDLSIDVLDDGGSSLQFTDCYCIVNDVDSVGPGAYQYHPDRGELELLHDGEYREEAGQLALGQRLAADAAVCVYFMADVDAVTDVLGDRGYRAAQYESAFTAGQLYLATYAHRDLGGTGLTFFDDMVAQFFEPRAAGQTPMFLYTLGRPVSGTS